MTTVGYLIAVQIPEAQGSGYRIDAFGRPQVIHRKDAVVAAGGAVVGLGIGMMHYIGMAAVIVPGVITWDTPYVVVSVLLGMMLASAGMVANHRLEPSKAMWVAPVLLTLGICSLHFTAMAAVVVVPDPTIAVRPSFMNSMGLAISIAGVTMLVMLAAVGAALVNAQAEREVERELRRHNEALRQRDKELEAQNTQLAQQHDLLKQHEQHLDAALNNMLQGLAMFDSELRLVIANERYAKMYGLTPEETKPGTTLRQIFEYRVAKGLHPGTTADDMLRAVMDRTTGNAAAQYTSALHDGRYITVSVQPMPGGGTVTTHYDITEQRRSEAKIAHMALHDALTGLPNRVLLNERLEHALARVERRRDRCHASPRPRSLQERQRYAGPSRRRQAAEAGRRLACDPGARRPTPSRAWAATSSPSCRSPSPSRPMPPPWRCASSTR